MIFMRVRKHDAEEIAALLHQIADIRKNEIDAGQILATKGDAEVDGDPLPASLIADAVEAEIHTDLAHSTERREDEFVARFRHQ
jgi:hypothetical protein